MNKRNRIVFRGQLPYLRVATVAGVMCAAVVGWPSACLAQEGIGLTLTPRQYVRPGDPSLTVDKDEDGQAQAVFKEPLWRTFVDTVTKELQPPPDPEQLATSCRRSIHVARLTSKALLLDGCISEALEDIDPVGSYISQRQYRSAQRERQRPAGALGLELPARKPYGEPLTVITPIEGARQPGPVCCLATWSSPLMESPCGL